ALGDIFESLLNAALFFDEFQNLSDEFIGRHDQRGDNGFLDSIDRLNIGEPGWVIDLDRLTVGLHDAITNAWRCGDQFELEFAFEPLLNDFHMKQAEKSAAKAKTQRGR